VHPGFLSSVELFSAPLFSWWHPLQQLFWPPVVCHSLAIYRFVLLLCKIKSCKPIISLITCTWFGILFFLDIHADHLKKFKGISDSHWWWVWTWLSFGMLCSVVLSKIFSFKGTYCHHHQGIESVNTSETSVSTRLHAATSQNTSLCLWKSVSAVSDLMLYS
jgi:hypothetical protein